MTSLWSPTTLLFGRKKGVREDVTAVRPDWNYGNVIDIKIILSILDLDWFREPSSKGSRLETSLQWDLGFEEGRGFTSGFRSKTMD